MIAALWAFLKDMPWRAIGCALLVALGFAVGHRMASLEFKEAKAKQDQLLAQWQAKAEKVNTVTVTQYVDRVQTVHDKGETILKEVPVYVPRNVCVLPADVRRLHDTAAVLPGAPEGADGQATAPEEAAGETR
jgi:ElaB/YqjD/DUF883 family membrane-anchored ribosome-binding protein